MRSAHAAWRFGPEICTTGGRGDVGGRIASLEGIRELKEGLRLSQIAPATREMFDGKTELRIESFDSELQPHSSVSDKAANVTPDKIEVQSREAGAFVERGKLNSTDAPSSAILMDSG